MLKWWLILTKQPGRNSTACNCKIQHGILGKGAGREGAARMAAARGGSDQEGQGATEQEAEGAADQVGAADEEGMAQESTLR